MTEGRPVHDAMLSRNTIMSSRGGRFSGILFSLPAALCCLFMSGCNGVGHADPTVGEQRAKGADTSRREGADRTEAGTGRRAPILTTEADRAGHARMEEELQKVLRETSHQDTYFNDGPAERLRAQLSALPATAPVFRRLQMMTALGSSELMRGNESESVKLLSEVHRRLTDPTLRAPVPVRAEVAYELGVAFLRRAETENCCSRHTPESCIFPIQGAGIHTRRESSRKAIEAFAEVLALMPPHFEKAKKARWLMNIASMTLGEYPDKVPPQHLIPIDGFRSDANFPRFWNIAGEAGLGTFTLSGGVIVDDFDNDGDLDLVNSSYDFGEPLRFFRNDREQGFTERTREAGLLRMLGGLNLTQTDYNNDGWTDIYVSRGAWWADAGQHPDSLLRNNGDGTFTDVTFAAGLVPAMHPSQTAVWADFDGDGWIDLYVGNESTEKHRARNFLFRNNGDGTFTEIAVQAGVANERYAKGVTAGDYDQDGDMDIYVSNFQGENRLYRNNGDWTFTDVAQDLGVTRPIDSFPTWFWDFDNDGNLDLFVASFGVTVAGLVDYYVNGKVTHERGVLYRGDGKGGFQDVSEEVGLLAPACVMGSNFGDLDNDGYLDFYLGTGAPRYTELMPNLMFWNRGGKKFVDVTLAGGFGSLQKGHAVAFADLDDDGDQDVFEQMGGALRGDKYFDCLYENPGFGNRVLVVQLVGTRSNRAAIGAKLRLDFQDQNASRTVYRCVNSGGSFGANPLRQSIGLGQAARVDRMVVTWPSGRSEEFYDLPANHVARIVEGTGSFTATPLRACAMPGSRAAGTAD